MVNLRKDTRNTSLRVERAVLNYKVLISVEVCRSRSRSCRFGENGRAQDFRKTGGLHKENTIKALAHESSCETRRSMVWHDEARNPSCVNRD